MRWEFFYHADHNYLEVIVRGNPTSDDLNAMAKERWHKLQELNCRSILIDFTAITSMLATFEIYHRPEETERLGILKINRTAAVADPAYWREFKIMENAYHAHGYDLRVFDNREDALAYLVSAPPLAGTS